MSKIQREQIRQYASSPYEKALFAGPEIETRLPSQLEDGTIASVKKSQKLFDGAKDGFFKKKVHAIVKHTSNLEAYQNLTFPQLSLDEWNVIFKTALERARITGEFQLNLDIPPIQPIVYNRPSAFEGMIHVDPSADIEKQRSQALAQILLLASEVKLGAYNAQDYLNPRSINAANTIPYAGIQRKILPIFWHYSARMVFACQPGSSVVQLGKTKKAHECSANLGKCRRFYLPTKSEKKSN